MITTVTPNPSIDHTMLIDHLVPGAVHRASRSTTEPSGKGVNVAVALHYAGVAVEAVLPVGGAAGSQLRTLLEQHGLTFRAVPISGDIRTNVTVVAADGTTTKFNEVGPHLTEEEAAELAAAAEPRGPIDWVVWAGSLPPGFTARQLADAIAENRRSGRRVALDCSGPALRTVLDGPPETLPHLIKPNAEELSELTGCALATVGDVIRVARRLVETGIDEILVSLGGDGAVLVTDDNAWHGWSPVRKVANTAGAGDALLAGYLAAPPGQPPAERLASALRFGADAVEQSGTLLVSHLADRTVHLVVADPTRPLQTPVTIQEQT